MPVINYNFDESYYRQCTICKKDYIVSFEILK